jgi:type VI protein secretion system component Hcp
MQNKTKNKIPDSRNWTNIVETKNISIKFAEIERKYQIAKTEEKTKYQITETEGKMKY